MAFWLIYPELQYHHSIQENVNFAFLIQSPPRYLAMAQHPASIHQLSQQSKKQSSPSPFTGKFIEVFPKFQDFGNWQPNSWLPVWPLQSCCIYKHSYPHFPLNSQKTLEKSLNNQKWLLTVSFPCVLCACPAEISKTDLLPIKFISINTYNWVNQSNIIDQSPMSIHNVNYTHGTTIFSNHQWMKLILPPIR